VVGVVVFLSWDSTPSHTHARARAHHHTCIVLRFAARHIRRFPFLNPFLQHTSYAMPFSRSTLSSDLVHAVRGCLIRYINGAPRQASRVELGPRWSVLQDWYYTMMCGEFGLNFYSSLSLSLFATLGAIAAARARRAMGRF